MLDVPLLVTEQNPDKLGKTVQDLDICHAKSVVAKTRFSMLVPEIECEMKTLFEDGKPSDVVLYGIEVRGNLSNSYTLHQHRTPPISI